jgi:hypothetical protein
LTFCRLRGPKGEVVAEQAAKRPKVEIVADVAKPATPRSSSDPGSVASAYAEMVGDKNKSVDNGFCPTVLKQVQLRCCRNL